MKAIQIYNICWNNIPQKLFCKLFVFCTKLHPIDISPHFLGAFSALALSCFKRISSCTSSLLRHVSYGYVVVDNRC